MGCTPSIHVSQTGVVYCRESDDSNSPRPSYSTSTFHSTHGNILRSDNTELSANVPDSTTGKGKCCVAVDSTDAENQTREERMKSFEFDIKFGPLYIHKKAMSVLLVFNKEDSQSDSLGWAAERIGYKYTLVRTPEAALEAYSVTHHDVIFIDHRSSKHFDAETLCRSIRAIKSNEHTLIIAVTKKYPSDKEEPSILPLLKAGFNRRFVETSNIGTCMNELLQLEYGEIRSKLKLRACGALFTALDNVSDLVEITNQDHEIQYVNHAFERLTGFTSEEVYSKDSRELSKNDKNKPDLHDIINDYVNKGKHWEGSYYTRRKSGEVIQSQCRITPVVGLSGRISQYVTVKTAPYDLTQHLDRVKDTELYQLANGGIHGGVSKRRESVTRIHSMTIEAPITKVINIINAAQENSCLTVAQALDKVLEILRSSELYSPYFNQQMKDEDPMTSDLVGGLVSQNVKRRHSNHDTSVQKISHHTHHHIPSSPTASLSQVPEPIQSVLDEECDWNFDIIELERVTDKRPLVYLGLKIFSRFDVCEFLNVSEDVLFNWLQLIESNYHAINTYHNSTHAADVLHATAYFLDRERVKSVFDQFDEVACLIAAVVHDVDHPGRTNAFLVNAGNPLALLYNDLAVLESHHAALAFQLSHRDDTVNIFKNMNRENYSAMRNNIIDMVLATEMKQHFEHCSKFVNSINKSMISAEEETQSLSSQCSHDSTAISSKLSLPENRTLIKRMLIKCADVSNPVRPQKLCIEWAKRIAEEYYNQTDEEKAKSLPVVMAVFDRKTCSVPKSQMSFIDVFITNMFDAWDYFCDISELMTHLQNNYQYWKDQEELKSREEEENTADEEENT
ncbi:hypothetical protein SNE40_011540 [Patella caerulea]|uniref:Phosphodiesterase n=1 Tax=Patella caerulea TaxID=87958 RepID=A0AAN8JS53_PATCE